MNGAVRCFSSQMFGNEFYRINIIKEIVLSEGCTLGEYCILKIILAPLLALYLHIAE